MKKILLTVFIVFCAFISYAQTVQNLGNKNTRVNVLGSFSVDSASYLPLKDTTWTPYRRGTLTMRPQDSLLYYWNSRKWTNLGAGNLISGFGISIVGNTIRADTFRLASFLRLYKTIDSLVSRADTFSFYRIPGVDSMYLEINNQIASVKDSTGKDIFQFEGVTISPHPNVLDFLGTGISMVQSNDTVHFTFDGGSGGTLTNDRYVSGFTIDPGGSGLISLPRTEGLPTLTQTITTTLVPEGGNLYFNNTRARGAVSATSPLLYNSSTGVFSIQNGSTSQSGAITNTDWNIFNGKQGALQWQKDAVNAGSLGGITTINFVGTPVVSASGSTLTVTVPDQSANIYNTDGTLTGDRIVTLGSSRLNFTADIVVDSMRIGQGVVKNNFNLQFGVRAFAGNAGSFGNVAIGTDAGRGLTTGNQNTFLGSRVGYSGPITGVRNSAFGQDALNNVTTGNDNNIFGYASGQRITTGINNAMLGSFAGTYITTGERNTIMGVATNGGVLPVGTGSRNVFIGERAAYTVYGNQNVFIGWNAGQTGYDTVSNRLIIENSNSTDNLISGDFLMDTLRIGGMLSVRDNPVSGDSSMKIGSTAWAKGVFQKKMQWQNAGSNLGTTGDGTIINVTGGATAAISGNTVTINAGGASVSNIYTVDGTLTGNRVATIPSGNYLRILGTGFATGTGTKIELSTSASHSTSGPGSETGGGLNLNNGTLPGFSLHATSSSVTSNARVIGQIDPSTPGNSFVQFSVQSPTNTTGITFNPDSAIIAGVIKYPTYAYGAMKSGALTASTLIHKGYVDSVGNLMQRKIQFQNSTSNLGASGAATLVDFNSGLVAGISGATVTVKADTAILDTKANRKKLADSLGALIGGGGVLAEKSVIANSTFYQFCYAATPGSGIINSVLRVGSSVGDPTLKTMTINAVLYVPNTNVTTGSWVNIGQVPVNFRPNNTVFFSMPLRVDGTQFTNSGAVGFTGSATYTEATGRVLADGSLDVYITGPGYATLGGVSYAILPIHVTYFYVSGS